MRNLRRKERAGATASRGDRRYFGPDEHGGYPAGDKTIDQLGPPPQGPAAGTELVVRDARRPTTTDLRERLESGLASTGLTRTQLARMLRTTPRTVARWLHGEAKPSSVNRERLVELLAVLDRLSWTLRPEAAGDWLLAPNPLLAHHKPAGLLREGRWREVLGAVDQLAEGVFV